ncbi:Hypothetical predicted protein [Pelobates cultripes]|uniref:Uncharacterized protein n=1 Tax=Pelobates cultripes TaxID=61616 RepID=A0AAD1WCE9_PELCU|nr:Hypothetical predicted protein [Pelobates cultripes]
MRTKKLLSVLFITVNTISRVNIRFPETGTSGIRSLLACSGRRSPQCPVSKRKDCDDAGHCGLRLPEQARELRMPEVPVSGNRMLILLTVLTVMKRTPI